MRLDQLTDSTHLRNIKDLCSEDYLNDANQGSKILYNKVNNKTIIIGKAEAFRHTRQALDYLF